MQNKTEREMLVEIAKLWPGHSGVNYETTTSENLTGLIKNAFELDQKVKRELTQMVLAEELDNGAMFGTASIHAFEKAHARRLFAARTVFTAGAIEK